MYIRTKNRIYETESPFLDNNGKWVGYNIVEDDMATILRCQVIREADTIEELCDEFVIDNWKEKGKPVYCFKYVKETNSAYCIDGGGYITLFIPKMLECGCIINGAIWTDKGLIYVAKMNKNGDLELI